MKIKLLFTSLILSLSLTASTEEKKISQMVQDLQLIRHTFDLYYAPMEWKGIYFNYSLDHAYEKAKEDVLANPKLSTRKFHQIVRRFVGSLNDYHVHASFFSTEESSLPFDVTLVEGRCFISWIDTAKFHKKAFLPSIGDEVLAIGGTPIMELIQKLIEAEGRSSNPKTDALIASKRLTFRMGKKGDDTPSGIAKVLIQSKETRTQETFLLKWFHTPDLISHPHDFIESWLPTTPFCKPLHDYLSSMTLPMVAPEFLVGASSDSLRPTPIGDRQGFLPSLGEIIWKNEQQEDLFFNYYLYTFEEDPEKKIGYLRIPSFSKESAIQDFYEAINRFEEESDALVIDLTNNPGGSALLMYEILSLLANEPLEMPFEWIKLSYYNTQIYRETKQQILKEIKEQKKKGGSEQLEIMLPVLRQYIAFFDGLISEWNRGVTFTGPMHLLNYDLIYPNPSTHYTKPIIVLVNEGDFSCGDYFPAILQDNKRATIFGTKTAGAGGAVLASGLSCTSSGIQSISYTYTLSKRRNGNLIENIGVSPDVHYEITSDDIQYGYKGYKEALNKTLLKAFFP